MLPVDMSQALSIVLDTQTLGLDFLALKAFPFWFHRVAYTVSPAKHSGVKRGFHYHMILGGSSIFFLLSLFITRERKQAHGRPMHLFCFGFPFYLGQIIGHLLLNLLYWTCDIYLLAIYFLSCPCLNWVRTWCVYTVEK